MWGLSVILRGQYKSGTHHKIEHILLQRGIQFGWRAFLCEAEAILNSRPITTPSSDPNNVEALTANHLHLLRSKPSLTPGLFQKEDLLLTASEGRFDIWQISYIDLSRGGLEYLPELQTRQRWSKIKRNFSLGDIVLLVDETVPRNSWVIGRIIWVIPDEHGLIRNGTVKTKLCNYYFHLWIKQHINNITYLYGSMTSMINSFVELIHILN